MDKPILNYTFYLFFIYDIISDRPDDVVALKVIVGDVNLYKPDFGNDGLPIVGTVTPLTSYSDVVMQVIVSVPRYRCMKIRFDYINMSWISFFFVSFHSEFHFNMSWKTETFQCKCNKHSGLAILLRNK